MNECHVNWNCESIQVFEVAALERTSVAVERPAAPLYLQIAEKLRALIDTGVYPPGSTLPRQAELLETLGVSTSTLAAATRILRTEGLLSRSTERGRLLVRPRPVPVDLTLNIPAGTPTGPWQVACEQAGRTGDMLIIGVGTIPAPVDVAGALAITPGADVVVRSRHATLDRVPACIDAAYYPLDLVEGTPIAGKARVEGGIDAALATAGILDPATKTIDDMIGARAATQEEAAIMKVRPSAPVLVADRITYNEQGRAVELLRRVADGARVRIGHKGLRLTPLP
ncbi:GntR family transcriptional regulator [Sphaerisporangium sp. NPDC004334]